MITDTDIKAQVQQAVDACEGRYDVDAITRQIVNRAPKALTEYPNAAAVLDDFDGSTFWDIVLRNADEEVDA